MSPSALLAAIEADPQNTLDDVAWWRATLAPSISRERRAERVETAPLAPA